jgi:hypothetical protein
MTAIVMILVTSKAAAKHELLSLGRFIEQKLMLSSNFSCAQIHNNHLSHFVLLLMSDLDDEQTGLRGGVVEQLSQT